MKKIITYTTLLFLGLSLATSTHATGLGVKPQKLNLQVKVGEQTTTKILVMNVTDEPALFQVSPDALGKNIKISPTDFRLSSKGSQLVKLETEFNWPGESASTISVVSRPLKAGGLTTASGIKIPLNVSVHGLPLWAIISIWTIIACLIVISIVLLIVSKKNQEYIFYENIS